jgi:uncharacterized membrane protein
MANIIILAALGLLVLSCSEPPPAEDIRFDESSIESVWHKAKLRGVAFRAIGQEPGWLLEITNGIEILLVLDYGQTRTRYPYVKPVVYQEERRTQYIVDEDALVVEIRGQTCQDTMSGEQFEVSVTIVLADRQLSGCGRALF